MCRLPALQPPLTWVDVYGGGVVGHKWRQRAGRLACAQGVATAVGLGARGLGRPEPTSLALLLRQVPGKVRVGAARAVEAQS